MKNVLFVAVHPDDETLGAGGTILKHKAAGDKIYWLIVTQANRNPDFVIQRDKTIDEVSNLYGFDGVYNLRLSTTELDSYSLGDLVDIFSSVIKEVTPNVIYLPFRGDVHSDHRIAFDTIYSCTKSFRYPFIEQILMIETLSETEFAPALSDLAFVPNVFIDIEDYYDKKVEIMRLYDSEIMEAPLPRSLRSIDALATFRGTRIGVRYAEAFMLLMDKR